MRQTAAAAARMGLDCSLVLRGEPPAERVGNFLLDELLGAKVHFSGKRTVDEVAAEIMTALKASGVKPYFIPLGGSNGLGAIGYVAAMEETLDQLAAQNLAIDAMVLASSSAGTQAGLLLGAAIRHYPGRVLGISIDSSAVELTARVIEFARDAARRVEHQLTEKDLRVDVIDDYLGGGYAMVGDLERDAIHTVARSEGLLLDPVYTGRAMGGLIDLFRKGQFTPQQRILFWHTGGTAALSAFADKL